MIKNRFIVLWLLLMASLCGCAVNTNINKYVLSTNYVQHHKVSTRYTLLVAEPTAQRGYDTDQLLYLACPYELKFFSRNSWVAPPHEMLTSIITQSLRNTGYFKAVVTPPYSGNNNYRLETKLIKLQQEFLCQPSRVHMVLHAVVTDANCHQVIGERVFEAVVMAPADNPYGGVIAANQATRMIIGQLCNYVIGMIQQHPSITSPQHCEGRGD